MHQDIIGKAKSVNGVDIRLTFERWYHISESHQELVGAPFKVLEAINRPNLVVEGLAGEFLALMKVNKKYLVGVYREINKEDGFVITAFYTSDLKTLLKKRKIIWKRSINK